MTTNSGEQKKWRERLSPQQAVLLAPVVSLVAGALAAVVLHYLLYRLGLPSKPFIYVAF
jgi:hypothetical protein